MIGIHSLSFLESEKEPDYRNVTIRTDVKVKDLYDVQDRLGTWVWQQINKIALFSQLFDVTLYHKGNSDNILLASFYLSVVL